MSKILDEIQSWLSQETDIDNIATYTKVFNNPKSPDFNQVCEDLLGEIRSKRYRIFCSIFEIESVVPEFISLTFFREINLENQVEIIQEYCQKYPKYFSKQLRDIYQADLDSIRSYLLLWTNYLYFTNSQTIINLETYLTSLCKQVLNGYDPSELIEVDKEVYEGLMVSYANNNYERHIPDLKLKMNVDKLLHSMTFLPKEVIEGFTESRFDQRTYNFLSMIHLAVKGLVSAHEIDIDLSDSKAVLHNLWGDMTFEKEYELSMTNKENYDIIPEDKNAESLMDNLLKLLTHTNIVNGTFQTQINQYRKNLTPEQDKEFKRILKVVMKGSPIIQMLFDPLDIEYFINRISDLNSAESREQIIEEMQPKVLDDFWPETRKSMLMMAAIF